MNHDLRLRYSQLKENDPTDKAISEEQEVKAYNEFYSNEGPIRNICFVWLDGRRIFVNYNDIALGEYLPAQNTITLTCASQVFVLTGVNLENLFYQLMNQTSKQITSMDKRYNITGDSERFVVNEIEIKNKVR